MSEEKLTFLEDNSTMWGKDFAIFTTKLTKEGCQG